MRKAEDPQEKMRLGHDRRHTMYENKKASRKNFPKGQQRRRMAVRRGVSQLLDPWKGRVDEDIAAQVELGARIKILQTRIRGFEKVKDRPFREVIAEKLERRKQ